MNSHSPLFEAGFHEIEQDNLEDIFVSPFNGSATRPELISRFKSYIRELKEIGIKFEVWVDGSFSTEKTDPNDIDIAVFASSEELNQLPPEKQNKIGLLLGEHDIVKARYNCDVYFSPLEDKEMRSYWRGWFGFSRNENPKGIPHFFI